MENLGEAWHRDLAKRVGGSVAARRKELGLTAQDLAARCAELKVPIHRTTITKIENGRTRFDLGELIALAFALETSPVMLLYPDQAETPIDLLPERTMTSSKALRWFSGEQSPLPGAYADSYYLANKPTSYVREFAVAQQDVHDLTRFAKDLSLPDELISRAVRRVADLAREMRIAGMVLQAGLTRPQVRKKNQGEKDA